MKLFSYSIYDKVAEIFNKPFTEINDATAIRAFTNSVIESPNKDDYVLYQVGHFNDLNGQLAGIDSPIKIHSGLEVKQNDVVTTP